MTPPPPVHESLPLFENSYLSHDAAQEFNSKFSDIPLTSPSPVHESTPLFPNSNLSHDPEEELNLRFSESDNTSPEVEQDVNEPGTNFRDNIPEKSVSDLPFVTNLTQDESDSCKT